METPQNPGGSLVKHFSKAEMCASPSLFAVASHQPINHEQIKHNLQMKALPPIPSRELNLSITEHPKIVDVNSEFMIHLQMENYSDFIINSYGSYPVYIAYHWMNQYANEYIVFDGERTRIIPNLNRTEYKLSLPEKRRKYKARIRALPKQGDYILRVTLVQEAVRWFDTQPTNLYQDIYVKIK